MGKKHDERVRLIAEALDEAIRSWIDHKLWGAKKPDLNKVADQLLHAIEEV